MRKDIEDEVENIKLYIDDEDIIKEEDIIKNGEIDWYVENVIINPPGSWLVVFLVAYLIIVAIKMFKFPTESVYALIFTIFVSIILLIYYLWEIYQYKRELAEFIILKDRKIFKLKNKMKQLKNKLKKIEEKKS